MATVYNLVDKSLRRWRDGDPRAYRQGKTWNVACGVGEEPDTFRIVHHGTIIFEARLVDGGWVPHAWGGYSASDRDAINCAARALGWAGHSVSTIMPADYNYRTQKRDWRLAYRVNGVLVDDRYGTIEESTLDAGEVKRFKAACIAAVRPRWEEFAREVGERGLTGDRHHDREFGRIRLKIAVVELAREVVGASGCGHLVLSALERYVDRHHELYLRLVVGECECPGDHGEHRFNVDVGDALNWKKVNARFRRRLGRFIRDADVLENAVRADGGDTVMEAIP